MRSNHDLAANQPSHEGGLSALITPVLLQALKNEYRMDWNGLHGFSHWCRVRENGLYLAARNGANARVVEYFAFFHDNQRHNDGFDPLHGWRASDLIRKKFASNLGLTPEEVDWLCKACEAHDKGKTQANLTIQTCWDSDRLDLMRAGIMPNKQYLCTAAAKDDQTIEWAVRRSLEWLRPGG